jgi:SAM-dependent methyltransferase
METDLNVILGKILLNHPHRVDRFDADYVDDFHHIVREQFGVSTVGDIQDHHEGLCQLRELFNLDTSLSMVEVRRLLVDLQGSYDRSVLSGWKVDERTKQRFGLYEIEDWENLRDATLDGTADSLEKIKDIQINYSFGVSEFKTEFWGRPQHKGPWWDDVLSDLRTDGTLHDKSDILCIGPRFDLEIKFFREKLGFERTMGFDLKSVNTELIIEGDMHCMPIENDSYDVIYQKNTFNKSYDIRLALDECVRVLRPGGILISDECMDYSYGTSEVARTSICSNEWYKRYLGEEVIETVYEYEAPSGTDWIHKVGGIALRLRGTSNETI